MLYILSVLWPHEQINIFYTRTRTQEFLNEDLAHETSTTSDEDRTISVEILDGRVLTASHRGHVSSGFPVIFNDTFLLPYFSIFFCCFFFFAVYSAFFYFLIIYCSSASFVFFFTLPVDSNNPYVCFYLILIVDPNVDFISNEFFRNEETFSGVSGAARAGTRICFSEIFQRDNVKRVRLLDSFRISYNHDFCPERKNTKKIGTRLEKTRLVIPPPSLSLSVFFLLIV